MNISRSEVINRLRTTAYLINHMLKEDIPDAISELQDWQEQELLAELKAYEIDLKESVLILYSKSYRLEKNIDRLSITAEESVEIETVMKHVRNVLEPFRLFLERCTALSEKLEAN